MLTNNQIPSFQPYHRLIGIGYGALCLMWFSWEVKSVLLTSLLGAGLALVLLGLGVVHQWGGHTLKMPLLAFVLFGMAVGGSSVLCTVTLMVLKNALHAHAYPDFPGAIVVGMFYRLIPWALAGGLLGGAWGLGVSSSS